jgi:uncharacterized protein (DUF2147 family)
LNMKSRMMKMLSALLLCVASQVAMAQATPAGLWKSIDDKSKKERSLVRINEAGGVYSGRIEKLLDPDTKPDAVCEACTDERKGKPVVGMPLIRNVKQNADDKEVFDGGDITDPDNGKVYRVRLKPVDGGKKLEVRGYIGPFYRNQVWLRAE